MALIDVTAKHIINFSYGGGGASVAAELEDWLVYQDVVDNWNVSYGVLLTEPEYDNYAIRINDISEFYETSFLNLSVENIRAKDLAFVGQGGNINQSFDLVFVGQRFALEEQKLNLHKYNYINWAISIPERLVSNIVEANYTDLNQVQVDLLLYYNFIENNELLNLGWKNVMLLLTISDVDAKSILKDSFNLKYPSEIYDVTGLTGETNVDLDGFEDDFSDHNTNHESGGSDEIEANLLTSTIDYPPFVLGATIGDKLSTINNEIGFNLNKIAILTSQVDQLDDLIDDVDIANFPYWSYHFADDFAFDVVQVLIPLVSSQIYMATVGSGHPSAWHMPSNMALINAGMFTVPTDGFYQVEVNLNIEEIANAPFERGITIYFHVGGITFEAESTTFLKKNNAQMIMTAVGTLPLIGGLPLGLEIKGSNIQNASPPTGQINLKVKSGFASMMRVFNS